MNENTSVEQLMAELARLRQENSELKLANSMGDGSSQPSPWSSPSPWFNTGKAEIFVSDLPEPEPAVDRPEKYKFSDLVDIPFLQQLLNSFYLATGIPHGLQDEDNNILSGIGWQDICTQFHRVCPQTEARCKQSDSYLAAHLLDGTCVGYKCMNGLMDYGTPIIVAGQHLATIILGQFLHQPPEEEFFRAQAQEYGFDEIAYLEALRKIPIIPEAQIEAIMRFYSQLGRFLATVGLERKLQLEAAANSLREEKNRLNLIWGISNDGFWEWNVETGQVYLSPRWKQIVGYSLEELEPHILSWKELIHPEDLTSTLQALSEHLEGRAPGFDAEYRMRTKAGEWKWVAVRGQIVARNPEGQPLRMAGIFLDITDRKQSAEALLQSEQKFSRAFHCNPDLMSISTLKDGRYVDVNDAFVEITGYSRDESIGHTAQDLGIWAVATERKSLVEKIQEKGSIRDFEVQLRLKSGEIRSFNLTGEIIELNGEPHLLNSSRDITESKQMIEELRFSEECFAKAFNASPVLMGVTSIREGRIIKVNNAFCRILGYSQEELIGRTTFEIGFWADLADRYLVQQKLIDRQSVQDIEIHFCTKRGEHRLGLYSAERLDVDNEPCILGVLTDITDLRQMEVEMTRLDRLNLVGEMAASLGHEIRNPMTTVRGYLQILRENENYRQDMECMDLMIEELDRANSIITEFLSLAKNKMVEMIPLNLNSIISNSLPLILAKAISQDQFIKLEIHDLPDLLLDQKEIRQMILNLVNNGLEAMKSAGEVTIRTYVDQATVVLAIQDQGTGIDPTLKDKLGTPFFTTKEQGTGLGLAVCYRIANRHNAKIKINSGPSGTTFNVIFPIPPTALLD